jgi:hypothetical protein
MPSLNPGLKAGALGRDTPSPPEAGSFSWQSPREKGASSRILRSEGHPTSWQSGYWAESVGADCIEALVRYVRGQRAHHAAWPPAEPWEIAEK